MFKIITAFSTCLLLLPCTAMQEIKLQHHETSDIFNLHFKLLEDYKNNKKNWNTKIWGNEQLALHHLESTANKGDSEAAYNAGLCYLQWRGVLLTDQTNIVNIKTNAEKAIQYLEQASRAGNSHATYLLYCYHKKNTQYLKKNRDDTSFESMMDSDYNIIMGKDISYKFLESAAYEKHPMALYKIICYIKKHHYSKRGKTLHDVLSFLDMAAEQTVDPNMALWAHNELGYCYKEWVLHNKNAQKSFDYFLAESKIKHGPALFYLGMHYNNGTEVSKSRKKALIYFEKSAEEPLHRLTIDAMFEAAKIHTEATDPVSLLLAFNYFEQVVIPNLIIDCTNNQLSTKS